MAQNFQSVKRTFCEIFFPDKKYFRQNDKFCLTKIPKNIVIHDFNGFQWSLKDFPEIGNLVEYPGSLEEIDFIFVNCVSAFLVWIKGCCFKLKLDYEMTLQFSCFLPHLNKTSSIRAIYDDFNQIIIFVSNDKLSIDISIYSCDQWMQQINPQTE